MGPGLEGRVYFCRSCWIPVSKIQQKQRGRMTRTVTWSLSKDDRMRDAQEKDPKRVRLVLDYEMDV